MLNRRRIDKISLVIQPALAGLIFLVCVFVANSALATTYTVGLTAGRPAFGNLVASSGGATFTETPSGSITLTSGTGGFDPPAGSRTVSAQTITISCDASNPCGTNVVTVTVTPGTPTGRITGYSFTATMGTAVLNGSGNVTSGSSLSFKINAVGKSNSKNFTLGIALTVDQAGTTTASTLPYTVVASAASSTSGTNSTSASATVYKGISVSSSQNLGFGSIVVNGSGTVALNALGTARAVTGGVVMVNSQAADPVQPAVFTIGGETGTNVSLSFTTTSLTGPGTSMGFTQNSSQVGTITLSSGSTSLTVGGTVTVGSSQTPGTYNGSVTLTVNYN